MSPFATILALLTGIAGWFYLFYSKSAADLAEIEDRKLNQKRGRYRRAGGVVMLLLSAGLYVGFATADDRQYAILFVAAWSAVMIFVGLLVLLALIDVRLTVRLRNQRLERNRGSFIDRDGAK